MVEGCIRKEIELNYTELRELVIEQLEEKTTNVPVTYTSTDSIDEVGLLDSLLGGFRIGDTPNLPGKSLEIVY